MKRSNWVLAGALVFIGLIFLFAAGLGLHSRSMMGMMRNGHGMPSMAGVMWIMGLRSALILFLVLAALVGMLTLVGLLAAAYRGRSRGSSKDKCPQCQSAIEKDWSYCPSCGGDLTSPANPRR